MTSLRQLDYLNKGWSVIPLQPKGKTPLIDWSEYQKRLPTVEEVTGWWTKWPNANTGLVTGKVSGLAIIDIDGDVGEESWKSLSGGAPTLTVKSGRGRHLYYAHPQVPVKNCTKVAPGIDIRGDGGYAVGPYSVHENGSIYAWVGGFGAINGALVSFPKNVLEMLGRNASEQEYQSVPTAQEPWVSELLKGVGEGEKHQALIRLAGYFNSKGLPKDVAVSLLLDWNTRNKPPADAKGIIERIDDVYTRYSPSISGRTNNSVGSTRAVIASTTPGAAYGAFKAELISGAKTIGTGFPTLDKYSRGLLRGNVSVIGSWPGVGKTAFTLGLARSIAERGLTVAYFPTEMVTNELLKVFISSGLSIPFKRVFEGDLTEAEHARVESYLTGEVLSRLHIVPITSPTLQDIDRTLTELKPDLMVLDHIQHTKGGSSNMRHDIQELMYGIKDIAKRVDCAALLTSQFHRPYKTNSGELVAPTMFDFAECGGIEREVSMALLMSPTDRYNEGTEFDVNFNLAKNRFGKVAEFQLKFNQEFVRFSE